MLAAVVHAVAAELSPHRLEDLPVRRRAICLSRSAGDVVCLGMVLGAIQAEVTKVARDVARLVAPALEERLAERYGPHWLNTINQQRQAAGAQSGRGLNDHRFCLAVYGHDSATEGWVDESLRRSARDLNTLANKAAHDDRLTPSDVDRARDVAELFTLHYTGQRPATDLRPPPPARPARQPEPPTIHVHELARELRLSNKACFDLIQELGFSSYLTEAEAEVVRRRGKTVRLRGQGPPVAVADLARELGMPNEECIELCQAMGSEVTSPSSLVSAPLADAARQTARKLRFGRFSPRRGPNVEQTPAAPSPSSHVGAVQAAPVSAAPADRVREWVNKWLRPPKR